MILRLRWMVPILWLAALAARKLPSPPPTRVDNVTDVLHGVSIVDPYRWLEDQESAETRAWIEAQNRYTHSLLAPLAVRPKLEARLTELMKVDAQCPALERNGIYFFTRKRANQNLPVTYMRKGPGGAEEVLIDPHTLSPDHTTSAGLISVSPDASLAAYLIRAGGTDEIEPRLMRVASRQDLPERFPRALYSGFSFLPDNSGVYYTRRTREHGARIYFHKIGGGVSTTPRSSDAVSGRTPS